MNKKRNSTIEMLRIISMLGVVSLHYFNKKIGGVLNTTVPANIYIAHFLESLCITSVNIFVLISGYFMIHQKTTGLRKAIDLYLTMVVYHLVFFAISIAIGEYTFSLKNLIIAVCPFVIGQKWFLETYILLLLFAPFLNILIEGLNKHTHMMLLVIWLLVFSLWSSFFPSPPLQDKGYGITNFVTLYLIASYIRLYVMFDNKRRTVQKALIVFMISVMLITLSSFSIFSDRAWGYCFIFNITASTAAFVIGLNLPKTQNDIVNTIAGTTFGIYISHANIYLSNLIYHRIMHTERYMDSSLMPIHFLVCIIVQFAICAALELLRQQAWKRSVGIWLSKSKWLKKEEEWEKTIFVHDVGEGN